MAIALHAGFANPKDDDRFSRIDAALIIKHAGACIFLLQKIDRIVHLVYLK